jgi:hypothetical protein
MQNPEKQNCHRRRKQRAQQQPQRTDALPLEHPRAVQNAHARRIRRVRNHRQSPPVIAPATSANFNSSEIPSTSDPRYVRAALSVMAVNAVAP